MTSVKILIEGYASVNNEEDKICLTISLIRDGKNIIVVDPGVLEKQDMLIEALENEGLEIKDIDFVFLTHSHMDHYRNIGMFADAKNLEFWGIWDKNNSKEWGEKFSDDIKIIKTPGHSNDSLTFLVKTDEGVVAICGDVFWEENYPDFDEYAVDMDQLNASRKIVLNSADYVIPGHGPIFKVKK